MSLSQCQQQYQNLNSTDGCNCTNYTMWHEAVFNPNPDDISCQFPQVRIVLLLLKGNHSYVSLVFLLECDGVYDRHSNIYTDELVDQVYPQPYSFHNLCHCSD